MSEHTVLTVLATLTVLAFFSFYVFFNPGKPSMQQFKRSGSRAAAQQILDQWSDAQKKKARANLAFDWFFIALYSATWIVAGLYFRGWACAFTLIGLAGAVCDVIENSCLHKMLNGNQSDSAPRICRTVMPLNIGLFMIAAVGLVAYCCLHR
jgi:hypothetical protein